MSMPPKDLERVLGRLDITAIVAGCIIGVGIFFAPAEMARSLPSPLWIVGAWGLGGAFSLCGALVLAEYSARLPRAGGSYAFLREAFPAPWGPRLAFLYAWLHTLVIQPGSLAIVALVLAEHLSPLLGVNLSSGTKTAVAAGCVVAFAAVNAVGLRSGARTQLALTGLKVAAVVFVTALGVGWGTHDPLAVPASTEGGDPTALEAATWLADGLIFTLFAFAGWQHGSFVAGSARDPERSVPFGIVGGVSLVLVLYVGLNLSYLGLLGYEGVAGSTAVAAEAAEAGLGEGAKRLVAGVVVVSAAGVLNTICLAFPYVLLALGREEVLFARVGRVHGTTGTPVAALLVLGGCGASACLVGYERIDSLLAGMVFGEWGALTALAFGLLRLRRVSPSEHFRAPRGVATTFAVVACVVALGALVTKPWETLFGVVVVVVGLSLRGLASRGAR